MSGALSQASASSYINQCQMIEEQTATSVIKALRACTGQWKIIAPLAVTSSTAFVVDPELSFPLKAQQKYVLEGLFLISSAAAGGAKVQLNALGNTSANSAVSGKTIATGTAGAQATIGNVTGLYNQTLNATSLYSNAQITDSLYFQVYISPAVDDLLTFSFAQNTSNATASVLLQGSWANLYQMSGSRRAPNVL